MNTDVGKRIAYFRKAKGLTVNRLANLSGVSQSYLRDIELGNNNNPTIEIMECLCSTLGITMRDFFDGDSDDRLADDPLIREIYQLNGEQKRRLLLFLQAMKNQG